MKYDASGNIATTYNLTSPQNRYVGHDNVTWVLSNTCDHTINISNIILLILGLLELRSVEAGVCPIAAFPVAFNRWYFYVGWLILPTTPLSNDNDDDDDDDNDCREIVDSHPSK